MPQYLIPLLAMAEEKAEGGGHGAGFQLIDVQWESVIWLWFIFLLLVAVLRKLAWPMITEAVERREVVALTMEAASKVLGRTMTADDDRRLAEQLVGEVRARRMGASQN